MWQNWKLGIRLCLAAVAALVLMACGGSGAGGEADPCGGGGAARGGSAGITLDGTWAGSFLEGGIPPALSEPRFAHSPTGTISAALTDNGDGTVSGTVTMTPDICAEGPTERAQIVTETVSGSLTATTLTVCYVTNTTLSLGETVRFTADFPADPILGEYDGTACDPTWAGGIRLVKQ